MNKIISALMLATVSMSSYSEVEVDLAPERITAIRTHTSIHPNANARGMALIKISGLEGGCSRGVFLDPAANDETLSLVLAAHVSKSSVRIGYNPDAKSPWGDSTFCGLTYFDIK